MARHSDPRMTQRYDRARGNLDRHGNYALAAFLGGAAQIVSDFGPDTTKASPVGEAFVPRSAPNFLCRLFLCHCDDDKIIACDDGAGCRLNADCGPVGDQEHHRVVHISGSEGDIRESKLFQFVLNDGTILT